MASSIASTGRCKRAVTCGTDEAEWIKTGDTVSGILETVVAERRTLRGENPGGDPARLQLPLLHPEVQAFLAAPIASPAHVYGWICLVGNEGRTFTEDDEHLMMALAGQVGRMCALEHEIFERTQAESSARYERDRARTAEERMRFALEAAGVGMWDMDYTTGVIQLSAILESQCGLRPGTFGGTFDAFLERIHADDRESVKETIGKAMKSGADFSTVNRSIWPDGSVHWLSGAGRILLGEHGEPVRGVGISLDVTFHHQGDRQRHRARPGDRPRHRDAERRERERLQ